jgi:hypothetical protein
MEDGRESEQQFAQLGFSFEMKGKNKMPLHAQGLQQYTIFLNFLISIFPF